MNKVRANALKATLSKIILVMIFFFFLSIFFTFPQKVSANINFGSGFYTNLFGCSPGPCGTSHPVPPASGECNTGAGSCTGNGAHQARRFVCTGNSTNCVQSPSGWSSSQSLGNPGCGNTVQIDVFSNATYTTLLDYMVWYSGNCSNPAPPPGNGNVCALRTQQSIAYPWCGENNDPNDPNCHPPMPPGNPVLFVNQSLRVGALNYAANPPTLYSNATQLRLSGPATYNTGSGNSITPAIAGDYTLNYISGGPASCTGQYALVHIVAPSCSLLGSDCSGNNCATTINGMNNTGVCVYAGNNLWTNQGVGNWSQATGNWISTAGTTLTGYQQNGACPGNKPGGGALCTTTITAQLPSGSIQANPNPCQVGDGSGVDSTHCGTTVTWSTLNAGAFDNINIFADRNNASACNGVLVASSAPNAAGSTNPNWIDTAGWYFHLCDNGSELSRINVTGLSAFDYSLSNTGSVTATQGGPTKVVTIDVTLQSGTAQPVTVDGGVGWPSSLSLTYAPISRTCTPNPPPPPFIFNGVCGVQISISASASTPIGSYPITVTGNLLPGKTTNFQLNIGAAASAWIRTFSGDVHTNGHIQTGGP